MGDVSWTSRCDDPRCLGVLIMNDVEVQICDVCKRFEADDEAAEWLLEAARTSLDPRVRREKLPAERTAITRKIRVGAAKVYATVGLYADGRPGEIFLASDKEGSTISGLLDAVATLTSIALQHGVPLTLIAEKMRHTRFEPDGPTGDAEQPLASSVLDAVFGWLERRFVQHEEG